MNGAHAIGTEEGDRLVAEDPARAAASAAAEAERTAGIVLRPLALNEELRQLDALLAAVWALPDGESMLGRNLLRALVASGNYVVGAFDGSRLVGGCVAFAANAPVPTLHSHIAGVHPALRGRNVGFALKLHQRAWALGHGYQCIDWTFDPLVRRNAHFNLRKLGARPVRYLTDFYGAMDDGINADTASDRVLLRWDLTGASAPLVPAGTGRALLIAGADGRPVRPDASEVTGDGRLVAVQIPPDIERLRLESPVMAGEWRLAVRETLGQLLAAGATVVAFGDDGNYLLEVDR